MDNFEDTAIRMYDDMTVLHSNEKWFNCCYLSGYIVECYAKLLISNAISAGLVFRINKIKDYRHDLDKLTNSIVSVLSISQRYGSYSLDLKLCCDNIITNWNPNYRYEGDSFRWNDKDLADNFKRECECVIDQILNMKLDGVI